MLTRADFASNQEVRWCPGCGDYAILATMQRTLPELGIPRENIVFISGIGCSGRFPYYMNTYGFHTIHGRAPAVATGLKLTRPELSVWIITGDGDGLSIGGNHLMHLWRRNVDVKVLLFNNRIYGLTKGQFSPTSEQGKVTVTSPTGTTDRPIDPVALALAAEATFVARVMDIDAKGLSQVLRAAAEHRGTAFIEIYQNCNIFNDGAFASLSDKNLRDENTLTLQAEQPLLFGKAREKAIIFENGLPQVVSADTSNLPVHRPDFPTALWAQQLVQLTHPAFPVPMGILRQVTRPVFGEARGEQEKQKTLDMTGLQQLLVSGATWNVI